MNRNLRALLLVVLVAVIVGVLLGVFLSGGDEEGEAPATVASLESKSAPLDGEAAQPESVKAKSVEEAAPGEMDEPVRVQEERSVARAAPQDEAAEKDNVIAPERQVTPPSFDVVRVSPNGRAVIAGRAEPGSEVTVLEDGIPLGSVYADKRGEWVLVPENSLAGGDRELSLVQEMPNGDRVVSEQVVVLSVPIPPSKPAAEIASQTARIERAEGVAQAQGTAAELVREEAENAVIAVLMERDGDGPSRILQSPDLGGEGIGDESEVTIRSVDYDSKGEVTLAGRTEPSATVNVYVDEEYVGSAKASETGEWQLRPEKEIPPGQHRLRIDKVDAEGIVLARIETPFSRARPEELLLGDALVVVQPGNSLWRIARRAYGGGIYYTEIYGANTAQILDPDMIFPGQIFTLPVLN